MGKPAKTPETISLSTWGGESSFSLRAGRRRNYASRKTHPSVGARSCPGTPISALACRVPSHRRGGGLTVRMYGDSPSPHLHVPRPAARFHTLLFQ